MMDKTQTGTIKIPFPDAAPIEQIAPQMVRYWLLDRQVVVYKMTSVAHQVVDAWIDTVIATMEAWPTNRPYLAIHDLTSENVSLTPYARTRAAELIPLGAKVPGYAAIVLPNSFIAQVIRLFMRSQRKQGIHNEIYFTLPAALEWLKTKIRPLELEQS
jgi:hypothetical protein